MHDDYRTGWLYGHKMADKNDPTDFVVKVIDICRETAYKTGDAFFLGIADYIWTKVLGNRTIEECCQMMAWREVV